MSGMMQGDVDMAVAHMSTETIAVPDKMVGLIIGRGGEQITRLQMESGCKIQMAPDSQGMAERQCTIRGSPQAIAAAKSAIAQIIANEGSNNRALSVGGAMNHGMGGGNTGYFQMMVPGHKVGLIIGKGGETIKNLQESTGARVVIVQESAEMANEKPLRITGSQESVERAKAMVTEILSQNDDRDQQAFGVRGRGRGRGGLMRGGIGGGGFAPRGRGRGGVFDRLGGSHWSGSGAPGSVSGDGGFHQEYLAIPTNKCGLVIGKGGETIKNINQTTGAHCEVDKGAPSDAPEKHFIIRGHPDAIERARQMILEKAGLPAPPAGSGYPTQQSGPYHGSWSTQFQPQPGYHPEQAMAAIGQQVGQDFTEQWINYYRQMGYPKEADAIEQNKVVLSSSSDVGQFNSLAALRPGNHIPSAPASNGATNGQPDYSAQWVDYYRRLGKYEEANAIEAQMKKNGGPPHTYSDPTAQFPAGGYYPSGQPLPSPAYTGYAGYAGFQSAES